MSIPEVCELEKFPAAKFTFKVNQLDSRSLVMILILFIQ